MNKEYRVLAHEGHGSEETCPCGKEGTCVNDKEKTESGCACGNCGC